jgi:hypothetical protein
MLSPSSVQARFAPTLKAAGSSYQILAPEHMGGVTKSRRGIPDRIQGGAEMKTLKAVNVAIVGGGWTGLAMAKEIPGALLCPY